MYAPMVTRFDTYAIPADGGTRAYMDAVLGTPAFQEWRRAVAQAKKGPPVAPRVRVLPPSYRLGLDDERWPKDVKELLRRW